MHLGAGLTRSRSDDILRARLKTVGVTEFRFDLNKSEFLSKFGPGASLSAGWHVYDVGGHRSMVRFVTVANASFNLPIPCSNSEVRGPVVSQRSSI